MVVMMMGGLCRFTRQNLQICSDGGTTTATSGPARCEAVLHGCGTSLVGVIDYLLAISKVISGRVATCDSVRAWRINSAASLRHHTTSTIPLSHIIMTLSQAVLALS